MTDIIDKKTLEQITRLDLASIACVEEAFLLLATKEVVMPPIMRLDIKEQNGEIDIKSAYVPGISSFAVKMSPGFFNNPQLGLPSLNGLMVLFSAETGVVQAILLDQGYLTEVRTAAAGGVAVRHLSKSSDQSISIIGTGAQAKQQLIAARLANPSLSKIFVWGRSQDNTKLYQKNIYNELGLDITVCKSVEEAVEKGQVIITTTPSTKPLVYADMLQAGQTIIAMGSDAEHKNEIDSRVFEKIDHYIADSQKQTATLGELHHAIKNKVVNASKQFSSLGQIILKRQSPRRNPDEIILCDLTGTGVQDTAIANFSYQQFINLKG